MLEDMRAAGPGFKTAPFAAAAKLAFSRRGKHMPDLSGAAIGAPVERTIQDEAAADAGGSGGIDHMGKTAPGSQLIFGQSGQVGVVIHIDWDGKVIRQSVPEGIILQAGQIGRIDHSPRLVVHPGGRADADARQLFLPNSAALQKAADFPNQQVHKRLGLRILGRGGGRCADGAYPARKTAPGLFWCRRYRFQW